MGKPRRVSSNNVIANHTVKVFLWSDIHSIEIDRHSDALAGYCPGAGAVPKIPVKYGDRAFFGHHRYSLLEGAGERVVLFFV